MTAAAQTGRITFAQISDACNFYLDSISSLRRFHQKLVAPKFEVDLF